MVVLEDGNIMPALHNPDGDVPNQPVDECDDWITNLQKIPSVRDVKDPKHLMRADEYERRAQGVLSKDWESEEEAAERERKEALTPEEIARREAIAIAKAAELSERGARHRAGVGTKRRGPNYKE
jgi:hypothetical protein